MKSETTVNDCWGEATVRRILLQSARAAGIELSKTEIDDIVRRYLANGGAISIEDLASYSVGEDSRRR